MIVLSFKNWCHSARRFFTYDRLYVYRYKWTPFVKMSIRKKNQLKCTSWEGNWGAKRRKAREELIKVKRSGGRPALDRHALVVKALAMGIYVPEHISALRLESRINLVEADWTLKEKMKKEKANNE